MTYLQTVTFTAQRNTLHKPAERKCSAKHSLRNVVSDCKKQIALLKALFSLNAYYISTSLSNSKIYSAFNSTYKNLHYKLQHSKSNLL